MHRDDFKEVLFDTWGSVNRDNSRALGLASYALTYTAARSIMRTRLALIVDTNFSPEPGRQDVSALLDQYQYRAVEVLVTAPSPVLVTRYRRRIQDGSRHPGHHDAERLMEFVQRLETAYEPLGLAETVYTVDTSRPESDYYPDLLNEIRGQLTI